MSETFFYILTRFGDLPQLPTGKAVPVLPLFRLGDNGTLLRLRTDSSHNGTAAMLSGTGREPFSPETVCRALERTCSAGSCSGLILDFERRTPNVVRLIRLFSSAAKRRGLPLFLPESCADDCPEAFVLISTALTGGTLETRLREASERFGLSRIVTAVDPLMLELPLPCADGAGVPLTQDRLQALTQHHTPCIRFSASLCARCFLYPDAPGSVRFVLFDDRDTIQRKIELARGMGIRRFLLPREAMT